jgi:hypothetical protein
MARTVVSPDDSERNTVAHSLVFLSTDGGALGDVGAADFATNPRSVTRYVGPGASVIAVVNLDAIASDGSPRVEFAGYSAPSAAPALVATAEASVLAQAGIEPRKPGALAQGVDLAFPFTFYEQGPLVARGISAVTLTTAASKPPEPEGDTTSALRPERLAQIGRSGQALLASLDEAAEVARGTEPYLYLGSRIMPGWAIQLVLLALLVPFLAATIDLLARVRARGIPLLPAARSLRSRLLLWAWAGGLFVFFSAAGILPNGPDRPVPLYTPAASDWAVVALAVLAALTLVGWLVARPRLAPRRQIEPAEELAGHLVAMLALGAIAIGIAATHPFSLVFVLPSLHAWLWLPHTAGSRPGARLALYLVGFAGPLVLLFSFAFRFGLGFDGVWYVIALTSVGYVPIALFLSFLAWGAVAEQVGALMVGRYAPYPERSERGLGPIRQSIRHLVSRRRVRNGQLTRQSAP